MNKSKNERMVRLIEWRDRVEDDKNGDGINKETREKSREMRFDIMRGREIK